MAGTANQLTAGIVKKAKKGELAAGMYRDAATAGLYLVVTKNGASWIYRFRADLPDRKRVREMGLGPLSLYSLQEARDLAQDARKLRHQQGIDPIEHRRAARAQARSGEAKGLTFDEAAERYAAAHRAGWRSSKHADQWLASLATHASPIIGKLRVAEINTEHVFKVLSQIWTTRTETASRVRGRIEAVLDWSKVKGLREGENVARWRGHLDHLLPAKAKVRSARHHPALPHDQMPAFMAKLRNVAGPAARALEFLVLAAARPGEIVGARWSEINLETKTWVIPGARMKSGREHRVPLSGRAVELLASMDRNDERVFGTNPTALLDIAHDLQPGIVPHGFRSTFRDWCAECTHFPSEVAEMALAHVVGSKVEAAYRRGDLFEKRRCLMQAWSEYCAAEAAERGKVVSLKGR
jgi:integrase